MTITTAPGSGQSILTPEEVQRYLVVPLTKAAVAAQVSTVLPIATHQTRIPIVQDDGAAAWTPETGEIVVDTTVFRDAICVPSKIAGLRPVSNELLADSSEVAVAAIGDSLVRAMVLQVDRAFFGDHTTDGPNGLESLPDVQVIEYSGAFDNLDPFAEALIRSESEGGVITSFTVNPTTALELLTLKDQVDSRRPLLGNDPTQPGKRTILGVPMLMSDTVPIGDAWAIPAAKVFFVLRSDASVTTDPSVFFSSDRTALRSTMRVGFLYPHQESIVRIANVSS